MKKEEYDKVYIDFHNSRAKKWGMSPTALWGSERTQLMRFQVLEKVFLSKSGFSVLDLGCGLGDFYPFLLKNGYHDIQFTGLEINQEFVDEAAKRYPDARFVCGDLAHLFADEKEATYDFIVSSGIYNLGEDPAPVLRRVRDDFKLVQKHVRLGYATNFLSIHADTRDDLSVYHDPADTFRVFTEYFGRYGRLYHDYMPHDFTLIMHRAAVAAWSDSLPADVK